MDISHTVKSPDGTVIAYRRSGQGPPVVLVVGALCTAESGAPLAALLAPRFDVITYDRRGRGASGDTAPYEVRREVEDLAALVAEAGGGACVYGMSSGAALALEAAAAGVEISQLALYEPPYLLDPAGVPASGAYSGQLGVLLSQGRRDEAVELFMSLTGMDPAMIAAMRRSPGWPALAAVAPTLAYDDAVLGSGLIPTERLATIGTRSMVVDGGASPAFLRDASRAVAEALPRGRHRTLTGQTHDVAPHVLAPVLADFFAG